MKLAGQFSLALLTLSIWHAVFAADITLPEVVVKTSGNKVQGYVEPVVRSATKTDSVNLETPVSVQVVSRDLMDDQQVGSVKDAVKNISGVFAANYEWYDTFMIRGFDNGYAANFRNGLQQQATIGLETANLERIEVLKGPAAVLYGRQEGPGGLINLVTKRPQAQQSTQLMQEFGSYHYQKTTLDSTGALNADKTLMYRVVGVYKDNQTFRDFVEQNRKFASFSLLWKPNWQFEGLLNAELQKEQVTATGDLGIPFAGNRPVAVPINRNLGDPIQTSIPTFQDRKILSGDWSWRFNEQWKLTQHFMYETRDERQNSIWLNGYNPATGDVARGMWLWPGQRQISALDQNIQGNFNALGMKHQLLAGIDFWRYHDAGKWFSAASTPFIPDININNPSYGMDWSGIQESDYTPATWATRKGVGYYLQDMLELGKWRVLLAGRQDKFTESRDWSGTGTAEHFSDSAFSPRIAALYQLTPNTSLFAGYNRSFGSTNGKQADGSNIAPEHARQYEMGIKAELLDGDVQTSAALFDLAKNNIKNPDLSNPAFSIPTGEMRNRGLELDASGKLAGGYSFNASYAYYDPKISQDTNGNQGKQMPNVPQHSANLWGKYDTGTLKQGWSMGLGANYRGERQANNSNTVQLPAYTTLDAMLEYRFALNHIALKAKLKVDNLGNRQYWDHAADASGAFYGTPRMIKTSLTADF